MPTAGDVITGLSIVAAVGCGLVAGVFFAFSSFVMKALAKLPENAGLPAMQSINVVVLNPVFLGVFVGTALVCLVLAALAGLNWDRPDSAWVVAGCLLYIVGTFGVTVFGNVPLNDALAAVQPGDASASAAWAEYLVRWTRWNHVRTIAATLAFSCLLLSLLANRLTANA
jgi:uncharacterized membrane protein